MSGNFHKSFLEFLRGRESRISKREIENFVSMNFSEVVTFFEKVTNERRLRGTVKVFLSKNFCSYMKKKVFNEEVIVEDVYLEQKQLPWLL